MKNLLICLEQLNIGGVETAVLNQAVVLKKMGYGVVVLAKQGLYTKQLEQAGIICIDKEFYLRNQYEKEEINFVKEVIEKYQIEQVWIHQFPCALSVLPACLLMQVPYILYLHTGTLEVYDWMMKAYPIFTFIFPLLFQSASKIISITESAKQYTAKTFGVSEDHYIVMKNGISLSLYPYEEKEIKEMERFLCVSRLANEKLEAIIATIDFFIFYSQQRKNKNYVLSILGIGEREEEIREYIKPYEEQGYKINLLGVSNQVAQVMKQYDVVMAMGRGIIEAIAMKKLPLIVGYIGEMQIVTKENIELLQQENFTARGIAKQSQEEVTKQLEELTNQTYQQIVEENYQFIQKNLNMEKQLQDLQPKLEYPAKNNNEPWIDELMYLQEKQIEREEQIAKLEKESLEIKEQKEQMQEDKNLQIQRIQALEKELTDIYHSKRWKYTDKISKIFH